MAKPTRPYLFAVYPHVDRLVAGIKALKESGQKEIQVYSPVPHHDIEHALGAKPSPVRVFTLVGGLIGLALGWGITIGPLANFHLHVGGKPLLSLPPFGVVAYICTILFGAIATLIGMVLHTRLPQLNLTEGYDARFSSDHFGIQVYCDVTEYRTVEKILRESGAVEVKSIEA